MFRLIMARVYYMWGSLHRNFGNSTSFQREHRAAVHRFTQAYEMDPALRQARLDRGILLWREMGRAEEALSDFNALLAEDPDYAPALLNRAMVAQEAGRYADALADLERYLSLPVEDEEYRSVARRTAALLQEIVQEEGD
ncbi:MAG: tetratricopeptide repeat protein [Chloroflexi bacterium]|nr:tetratricopeptide repeat protein [Chloroflexota bacterium]MCI0578432.1 tetratricopeptide repeat protein [Chloroflexota bacterium]MCI0643878.1 tetratricopeptide repeat protein [Chloroflexota bacterium]MCI0731024.1 tetratricopeptide repeat protein [Chloroflexota bacterium]